MTSVKENYIYKLCTSRLASIRYKCLRKGKPFDLDYMWFRDRLERGVCEVTGIDFILGVPMGPFSPELDQTIAKGGYLKSNVKVVIRIYNLAKNEYKHEDVIKFAKALIKSEDE